MSTGGVTKKKEKSSGGGNEDKGNPTKAKARQRTRAIERLLSQALRKGGGERDMAHTSSAGDLHAEGVDGVAGALRNLESTSIDPRKNRQYIEMCQH